MTTRQFLERILNAQKKKIMDIDAMGRGWSKVPYLNHQFGKLPLNKAFKVAEAVEVDFIEIVRLYTKIRKE